MKPYLLAALTIAALLSPAIGLLLGAIYAPMATLVALMGCTVTIAVAMLVWMFLDLAGAFKGEAPPTKEPR